jgi:large subunit ribosomal protein L29e
MRRRRRRRRRQKQRASRCGRRSPRKGLVCSRERRGVVACQCRTASPCTMMRCAAKIAKESTKREKSCGRLQEMAKSKNHTSHNQSNKAHKNGIKRTLRQKHQSCRGMDPKFLRNQRFAPSHTPPRAPLPQRCVAVTSLACCVVCSVMRSHIWGFRPNALVFLPPCRMSRTSQKFACTQVCRCF